jgi:hypothetical protein
MLAYLLPYRYKVLGEQLERLGDFKQARHVFAVGLTNDASCAPLYHAAALLEARLGNLEGLHGMHSRAQGALATKRGGGTAAAGAGQQDGHTHTGGTEHEKESDVIEKISMLVEEAEAGNGMGMAAAGREREGTYR